jgi:signal transduction histidine kinase
MTPRRRDRAGSQLPKAREARTTTVNAGARRAGARNAGARNAASRKAGARRAGAGTASALSRAAHSAARSRRAGLGGLRPRLILAFVLVAFITGLATTVLAYVGFSYLAARHYIFGSRIATRLPGAPATGGLSISQLLLLLAATVVSLLAFAVFLALLASRRVLRPVRRLANAADRLASGDLRIRLTASGSDEMADLVRTFNEMSAALEKNVEDLRRLEAQARRFAADVSHELRTPLAAMTAVADLLNEQAGSFQGDAAAAARLVSSETRNLNRLVSDLIEISRFDAGTATLMESEVDVASAVGNCLRSRGWAAEVTVVVPPGLVVTADPRRLDVILANLVGNALRHGGPPVTLRVDAARPGGQDWVAFEVCDSGPGLSPGILPHVFDRFYKADTARTRSEGSGLGLAIAQENAKLHGGAIEAANRPGSGAAFTARLPLPWATRPDPNLDPALDPGLGPGPGFDPAPGVAGIIPDRAVNEL